MSRLGIATSAKRIGTALMASLTLIAGSAIVASTTAEAVTTEGFAASNLLVKKDSNEDGAGRTFSFDWSAEELGRMPEPGEGFEIQSVHWLQFTDSFAKKPMTVGDKEIGTCLVEYSLISCTVDERIKDLDANQAIAGSFATGIKTFSISGRAGESGYFDPYVTFKFNGRPVLVSIPEGKDGTGGGEITKASLTSGGYEAGQDFLTWNLDFIPGAITAIDYRAFQEPDGKTVISYSMTAIIDERFDLENFQKVPWELREISRTGSNTFGSVTTLVDTSNSPNNDFSIHIAGSGAEKEITLSGPFKPDARYRLYMPTKFGAETVPVGEYPFALNFDYDVLDLSNTVQIYDWMVNPTGYETVSVWGTSSTDYGVPADPFGKIKGEVTYDLPEDTTASDYPDWRNRPKGIADDDGQGTIAVDYGYSFSPSNIGTYPVGTTISFVPGDPSWTSVRIDPEKTTTSPETLTVTEGAQNRFTVTYAVIGSTKRIYGATTLEGEEEAVQAAGGNPIVVDYTCTENGATSETGSLEIPGGGRSSNWITALPGAECVMKVNRESLPLPEGFAVDPELSELEKTITVADDPSEVNFKLHFVKSTENPVTAPAETAPLPDDAVAPTSEQETSIAQTDPLADLPTDEPSPEAVVTTEE